MYFNLEYTVGNKLEKIGKVLPLPVICLSSAGILSKLSVILSKAKNPGLGGETLRFAQGDNGPGGARGERAPVLNTLRGFQELPARSKRTRARNWPAVL